MRNYIQPGENIDFVAPADVASGDLVVVGALVGCAIADTPNGRSGVLVTEGVHIVPKSNADLAVGDIVYAPAGVAVSVVKTASGNSRAGIVVVAAPAAAATVRVKLGPSLRSASRGGDGQGAAEQSAAPST